jgi:hypothetical protein
MLNIKTKSKEHSKYRIHLAREQEECRIPDGLVDSCPEFILWLREHEEIHVLNEMYQDDSRNSNASENVGYIYSSVGLE